MPDITNPFFSTIFIETEKYALNRGYTIILGNSMGNHEIESRLLRMLTEKQVDTIVFMGGRVNHVKTNPSYAAEMNQILQSTPLVLVNGKMTGVDCYNIVTDEEKGLSDLLEYLISLGHVKIGLLGGRQGVTASLIKYDTFTRVLKKHRLPVNSSWILHSGYSIESGVKVMNELLAQDEIPTAVIGINDYVAVGMVKTLQAHSIRIPEDISVAGFDGSYISEVTIPQLTTVSQNYEEVGKAIIDTIIAIMNNDPADKLKKIGTKLMIRGSCRGTD